MKEMAEKLDMILDGIEKILSTQMTHNPSPWMTTAEAARYLRCSITKIDQLTNSGFLPFRRLDPRASRSPRIYHKRDLTSFLVTGRNPRDKPLKSAEMRAVVELL